MSNRKRAIFSSVKDGLPVAEAARRLRTTPPTVRALLSSGQLQGHKVPRGTRFAWRVDELSLQRYEAENGKFTRKPVGTGRLTELERQVAALTAESHVPSEAALERTARERDELRATVVTLKDLVARTRTVAELQQRADAERSTMIEHLLAAVAAGERADVLRQAAITELNEAVMAASQPGHPGALRPDGEPG
jgi:excisionase family DNA binding protein